MQQLTTKQKMYLVRLYQCLQRQPNPRVDICIPLTQLADVVMDAYSNALTNVKRLETMHLLNRSADGKVGFSGEGLTVAQHLIFRWRVVEIFLVNVIGLDWTDLEPETAQLYSIGSDKLIDRMWETAGRPPSSPFGEPIDPTLSAPQQTEYALASAPAQQVYTITRIITRDSLQLQRLHEIQLLPNQTLHLLDRRDQTGTVQLRVAQEQHVVARVLAEIIMVRKA
jgi:DtxR family transcriptional regulator, Mn-dependent transcriptional regulator